MSYSSDDLITLGSGQAYREKIGMYLSADRQEAINLGLRELVVNAQDEFEVFKPKNAFLKIKLNTKTREIEVCDNLRGIPVGVRDDGINSLTAAFLLPHSGAKHKEGAYFSSVGINGQGNKIVNHTARWLNVEVKRDGKIYRQEFKSDEEGAKPITDVTVIGKSTETGTCIWYEPDKIVYGDIFIDVESLRNTLKEMSFFTKGLKIILEVDGKEEQFHSKNGLIDGLSNKTAFTKPFSYFYDDGECQVELAFQWVAEDAKVRGYANGLYMPNGGAFITGFRTALTRFFNKISDKNLQGIAVRRYLDGFVSVKVRQGQFTNQQKTALANQEAQTAAGRATTECFEKFYNERRGDFEKVIELLVKTEKAEIAAEKARAAVLSANKEITIRSSKKVFASDKLKDAEKLGQDSTLVICEGDSALGALAQARDTKKYGLLALRGKIINPLTNDLDKVLNNEEVRLILSALGVGINNYSAKKLRYGRVAIASDADSDGAHIFLLVLTLFRELMPEFLKEERIYRLESPLYVITTSRKNHYYYSSSEAEKSKVSGTRTLIKGLGELSAQQMKESMFGEAQRLTQIKWDNDISYLLYDFMGKDVEPRKEFLFANADFNKILE